MRSSGDLPGSDRGPPRPPRPLLRGSGDPAASRHSRRATAGQRRAWRPGSRRDSRQLTQVSRAGREGREGRRCAAGRGRSAGRSGLTRGGEGNSGAGASLPGSRGTGRRQPGAPGHPHGEAVTAPPGVGLTVWDRLDPVASGKASGMYVQASFHPVLLSAPSSRLFVNVISACLS